MIVWAFLSLSVTYVIRQPTVHRKGYCFQHMFWLQAFSWMDWNMWSGKTSVLRIYCKYGFAIYCRLTKKKVLDCRWHKKGVIEFKFMKKPRAICMSSRLRWKGYIISIFVDGNAFVFFSRCGVSSSGIRWHLRGLQFQDSQGFKARRKAIWILYGYWNFFASICKWILVTKRYNSLWETWPKMWTSMALISNVWYSDGQ